MLYLSSNQGAPAAYSKCPAEHTCPPFMSASPGETNRRSSHCFCGNFRTVACPSEPRFPHGRFVFTRNVDLDPHRQNLGGLVQTNQVVPPVHCKRNPLVQANLEDNIVATANSSNKLGDFTRRYIVRPNLERDLHSDSVRYGSFPV